MSFFVKLLVSGVALYAVVGAFMLIFQRKLMYFPDTRRILPSQIELTGVDEELLQRGDGVQLVTWYTRARPGRPTLLYFHGNGGGLYNRAARVRHYQEHGLGVWLISYRGYAGSTGRPSERAIIADALAAYDALVAKGVPERDIVLYGESLGTGVAVQLATQRTPRAVILEAPFTAAVDVGAEAYPFVPVRVFMADKFMSRRYISRITAPLLIFHGEKDRVIPVAHGRKLLNLAPEPKTGVFLPDAGHDDLYSKGAWPYIRNFLRIPP